MVTLYGIINSQESPESMWKIKSCVYVLYPVILTITVGFDGSQLIIMEFLLSTHEIKIRN